MKLHSKLLIASTVVTLMNSLACDAENDATQQKRNQGLVAPDVSNEPSQQDSQANPSTEASQAQQDAEAAAGQAGQSAPTTAESTAAGTAQQAIPVAAPLNSGTPTNTPEVVADNALLNEDVASYIDEVLSLSDSHEFDVSSVNGLSLTTFAAANTDADKPKRNDRIETRTCIEPAEGAEDKSTTVTIHSDLGQKLEDVKSGNRIQTDMERMAILTQKWLKTSEEGVPRGVPCKKNGLHIDLKLEDMTGTTMNESFEISYSHAFSRFESDKPHSFNRSSLSKGTRKVEWIGVQKSEDGKMTLDKNLSFNTHKAFTRLDHKGQERQTSSSIASEGLKISDEVMPRNRQWISREITGKITIATQDQGKIEVTFDHAKFARDAECDGVSGSISGTFSYSSDGTEISSNFKVDLASGESSLDLGEKGKSSLEMFGCALTKVARNSIVPHNSKPVRPTKLERKKLPKLEVK